MPREESPYAVDWLRIAEKDLGRVERMLEDDDPEMAGFCLQQAMEKFLKAFLCWPRVGSFGASTTWKPSWMTQWLSIPALQSSANYVKRFPHSIWWSAIHWSRLPG